MLEGSDETTKSEARDKRRSTGTQATNTCGVRSIVNSGAALTFMLSNAQMKRRPSQASHWWVQIVFFRLLSWRETRSLRVSQGPRLSTCNTFASSKPETSKGCACAQICVVPDRKSFRHVSCGIARYGTRQKPRPPTYRTGGAACARSAGKIARHCEVQRFTKTHVLRA